MFCVGLTGGIGSGKSSAARQFGRLGACVIDVDDISHAMTQPGGAAIAAIRNAFGAEALAPDGRLNRAWMRERVFADAAAKQTLEVILHPMIGAESRAQAARSTQPYVILVVPLLLERDTYRDIIDRVAVVDCPEHQQIERTMQRSALSDAAVRAIMAAQLPRAERLAKANDVIDNSRDPANLERQVPLLHTRYLDFAAAKHG